MPPRFTPHPLDTALHAAFLALLGSAPLTWAADAPPLTLNPVVVTGSRAEAASFDMPAAIDVLEREQITAGQPRVNASEALIAVPGVVANNRQNYAQDLQISTRGFGARSAFGVRGVKLIADGIPASMPDGQGQAATFNLDVAERMEILRGPYSAVYGNHSGGVIQLFTRAPSERPSVEGGFAAGSYGTTKADLGASGTAGALGYVFNASRFDTNGYRDHSAATRDQAFLKLTGKPDEDSKLTFVMNGMWQHDTQDPLGLSWAGYKANPRAVDSAALSYNTRKSIDHLQAGVAYERKLGRDLIQLSAYSGQRSVIQFQSIPASVQGNPRHSGGIIDFDRNFYGFGARYIAVNDLAGGRLTTTVGVDLDSSTDQRRGYENFVGSRLGVKGRLRRNETDSVESLDPYLQAEWARGAWAFTAGVRHSQVKFKVDDQYIVGVNGDDSGRRDYRKTTPVLGVVYKLNPAVNLYASAGRGFETPTLNEMFYSGTAGAFNFGLNPSRSTHYEVGAKAFIGHSSRLNVAAFQITTEDELVVDASSGGRTSYKNAGKTLRQGVEASFDTAWRQNLTSRLAVSHLRAIYDEDFRTGNANTLVSAGKLMPGIPRTTVFGDLAWKITPAVTATVEGVYRSRMYVEDTNLQRAAPAYFVANLRLTAQQQMGAWRFTEFARLDNLFDRDYLGSVVVGDTNGRYYEPAPGRNWMAGVSARYTW
ncbi:TonB-dependent receptor [Zoogloea sp.]|uniref:TonB-dependent receptor family protein n=1 Tax=Zoogloea sp. TaxID=49181 RepID=UPI002612423A|nr:TonB-dependent receptor [Zoogloea sp.]MDD3352859.1 TonB-dependent receptor [Zoogloea sp.]